MCESLRFGDEVKQQGDEVEVFNTRTLGVSKALWAGHAQSETKEAKEFWKKEGKPDFVTITPDTFEKKDVEFALDESAHLFGMILGRDVEINGKIHGRRGELFLLTREARTQTEKSLHERWPVIFEGDDKGPRLFESTDIQGEQDHR